jgi:hypothetical protein
MFKAETTFGEYYNDWFRLFVRALIEEVSKTPDPEHPEMHAFFSQYTPDQIYSIVAPVIPDFRAMGKLTQHADVTYKGDPNFANGEATLAALDFSTQQYGLTGEGTVKRADGQMLPSGSIALHCKNCYQLIDDMADYARRWQAVIAYFSPGTPPFAPDQEAVDSLKRFLQAIADPQAEGAEPSNLNFTLVSDGASNFSIGGQPLDVAMEKFARFMGPTLKRMERMQRMSANPDASGGVGTMPDPMGQVPAPVPGR